jgi:DNA-binding SARP family transcriptional activator/tetratricopeptide (TPR) repeat protein
VTLRIRLLGGLAVGNRPATDLGSRKARRLLAVLALARGGAVPADLLVDLVWEGEPSDQLPVLVSRLRATLGRDRLPRSDAGYALLVDWLDVEELSDRVADATSRLAAGSWAAARSAAQAALALATGPLLPEEPDADWAGPDRLAVERLVLRGRLVAAEAELMSGDPGAAAARTAPLVVTLPDDEEVLRLHLTALAAAGRSAQALMAYEQARRRWADELGVDASAATREVHRRLLVGAVPVIAPPRARTLAGRSEALARLDARLLAGGGAVLVRGGAGMGKTTLVEAWVDQVRADGRAVLVARGQSGQSHAWQPLLDAVASLLLRRDPDDVASVLGDDAALIEPLLGRRPALGVTLDLLAGAEAPAHLLLARALEAVLRRCGSVLVLDDAQLADSASLALLQHLARVDVPGLVVVATSRPEELGELPGADVIDLPPLDLESAISVVGVERAADLLARSGGNPLLLVELAAVRPGDELPATIRAAVGARADRTGDAAVTLRAAAVLDAHVDLDLLATVLGRPAVAVLDDLEIGVRHGLLDDDGGGFVFRHALVREALESSVGSSRRALLHREAARALARRAPAQPLQIARHAMLAGERVLAGEALVLAAADASARYDAERSEALLDEALQVHDSVAARVARCRVRLARGRDELAQADADHALGERVDASTLEVAALCAYYGKDFNRAVALADQAADRAEDAELRVRCRLLAGRASHAAGDLDSASWRLLEAEAVAPAALRDMAVTWTGSLLHHRGEHVGALARLGLPASASSPSAALVLPHTLMMRALALAAAGRPADALRAVEGLSELVDRMHLVRFAGRAENVQGYVLRNLGAVQEADDLTRAGLAGGLRADHLEPQAHALLDLAEGRLLAGDLAAASDLLQQAEPYGDPVVHPHTFQWRHVLRGRLLRTRIALVHDPALAEELASGLVADTSQVLRYAVLARLTLARARLLQHAPVDLDEVEQDLRRMAAVAGLEQWRIAAELAADTGSQRLLTFAQDAAGSLITRSAERAEVLRTLVASRI